MKPKFGNFTRGSQLIEAFSMMFAAGLKPMLWVIVTLFSVSLGFLVWKNMEAADLYRVGMKGYSWFWDYLKLNPSKPVNVVGPSGYPVQMPVGTVDEYPPVAASWKRLMSTLGAAVMFSAFVALPVCFAYAWFSQWLGRNVLKRNHERGATIAELYKLKEEIAAFNSTARRAERREDFRRLFGPWWRLKAPFTSKKDCAELGLYEPYTVAGVSYPWRTEQTHMFSIGTTGTGKSTMMRDLLDQIRTRNKKAVVFDLTGAFIESFYDPARDVILNPFDERCPQWSIFNDCQTRAEFTSAAEALIPSDGGGAEPFWVQAARLLFVEACVALAQKGKTTNRGLYEHLMTAALKDVNTMVGGSVASPLTDPQAARMAESIRATMNTNINAIQCLPHKGEPFSIKEWVMADKERGSILFIAARHVDLSTVKVLLTLWMDMTINAMMSGSPSPRDVKLWFLFDELGALHRLPAIEKGMQTARNYGGAFVLGVHTIAKLRDTYGDKIAETLGSLARTKLILSTADYTSAKWCSEQIGNGEWSEMEQGVSFGVSNVRDAITLTNKRQLEPLVLPDDISKLRDLNGWLVFPQKMPAAKVKLEYRHWPKIANGYIERPDLKEQLLVVNNGPKGDDPEPLPADGGYGIVNRAIDFAQEQAAKIEAPGVLDTSPEALARIDTSKTMVNGVITVVASKVVIGEATAGSRSGRPVQLSLPVPYDAEKANDVTRDGRVNDADRTSAVNRTQSAAAFSQIRGQADIERSRDDDGVIRPIEINDQGDTPDNISFQEQQGPVTLSLEEEEVKKTPGQREQTEDLTRQEARINFTAERDGREPGSDMELGM